MRASLRRQSDDELDDGVAHGRQAWLRRRPVILFSSSLLRDGDAPSPSSSVSTVDWYTYSGFRRYHSECHVCHGPDGKGSSNAPALKDSLKAISYSDFVKTVVNGRKNVNTASDNVMPAFGTNPNVMCYLDDIFVYLRARANDAVPRGRPVKHEEKSKAAEDAETGCMGDK